MRQLRGPERGVHAAGELNGMVVDGRFLRASPTAMSRALSATPR